jgi:hypothetical protein
VPFNGQLKTPKSQWMWLGQAAKWKVAADIEMSSHFLQNAMRTALDLAKAAYFKREGHAVEDDCWSVSLCEM